MNIVVQILLDKTSLMWNWENEKKQGRKLGLQMYRKRGENIDRYMDCVMYMDKG